MSSELTVNSLSTCFPCDHNESSWDCDRSNFASKNNLPVQHKVIYSGIGTETETEERVFKHVKDCYCSEPPIEPFRRLVREPRLPVTTRKTITQHGVKRVPKTEPEVRNAFTQTSSIKETFITNDESNPFELSYSDFREDYERTSKTNITNKNPNEIPNRGNLKNLIEFRKENYFETHSAINLSLSHECVHHFRVNDRLLPEPINSDPYGNSLCLICDRILEAPPEKMSPSAKSLSRKEKRDNMESLKKKYEYRLNRPVVGIGTGREVMKIDVPAGLEAKCFDGCQEEMAFPKAGKCLFGSLALRYQKRDVS